MPTVVCTRCRFSQMPAERCGRCGEALQPPTSSPEEPGPPQAKKPPLSLRAGPLAALGAAVILGTLLWIGRSGKGPEAAAPAPTAGPTAGPLDLSGRWRGQLSKVIGANPPRPILKEISIESGREGGIFGARVVFTDPGRGGAGAGYRIAPDGPRRLAAAAAALDAEPKGAPVSIDFLQLPGWVPERARLWRALEGAGRGAGPAHYVLIESLESDYLIQAGINESGFLSYAFFSPAYAPRRGEDVLSRVIHPGADASLRGFQNLVWDLSGAADFLKLQLPVTLSGPEGATPDTITLTRSEEAPGSGTGD